MFVLIKDYVSGLMICINTAHIIALVPDGQMGVVEIAGRRALKISAPDMKELLEVLRVHKMLAAVKNGEKPAL